MWEVEGRFWKDEELLRYIESNPCKLLVMSGPTACGKTNLVKQIRCQNRHLLTSEAFCDFYYALAACYHIKNTPFDLSFINHELLRKYGIYDCLIVEDIDMMSCGRYLIQEKLIEFISRFLCQSTMIFTGMDCFSWPLFWELYRVDKAVFVTYCDIINGRICEENTHERKVV